MVLSKEERNLKGDLAWFQGSSFSPSEGTIVLKCLSCGFHSLRSLSPSAGAAFVDDLLGLLSLGALDFSRASSLRFWAGETSHQFSIVCKWSFERFPSVYHWGKWFLDNSAYNWIWFVYIFFEEEKRCFVFLSKEPSTYTRGGVMGRNRNSSFSGICDFHHTKAGIGLPSKAKGKMTVSLPALCNSNQKFIHQGYAPHALPT